MSQRGRDRRALPRLPPSERFSWLATKGTCRSELLPISQHSSEGRAAATTAVCQAEGEW